MYDTILIPTDGSTAAENAARHGIALATAFGSQVHLLSVVDKRSYSIASQYPERIVQQQRDALEEQAAKSIQALEAALSEHGVACQTAVEDGVPHSTILSYAADHDIDLISMGTHGRTGLDRLLIGSVTERVVRSSDVPVLTSRHAPEEPVGYDRLLIPTDGSEAATDAIDHGLAVAEQYDATVHALSVMDVGSLAGAAEGGPDLAGAIEALEDAGRDAVETVAQRGDERGVDVVTHISQGVPFRKIREYITEENIDFVTMGTHGRTGLERYLVGSVAERTVRSSDAPVLTVR